MKRSNACLDFDRHDSRQQVQAPMHDRRSVGRTRLSKGAKILANRATIPCTIVDLTNGGACIHIEDAREVPDRFELSFGNRHARRACRVTWRANNHLGVAFEWKCPTKIARI
jgi:hypothetical protein